MITCPSCGEDDDLSGTRLPDGRVQVRCGGCGHEWTRGVATPPPRPTPASTTKPTRAAARTGSSAAQVNERATAAVIVELERRGATCRIERVATNRREIRVRTNANGPEVAVVVRARTSGDWQTRASYGEPWEPEQHPTRFWIFVDLQPDPPAFFIHPEWAILNDIHVNHQQYLDANGGHRIVNDDSDHHSIKTDRVAAGRVAGTSSLDYVGRTASSRHRGRDAQDRLRRSPDPFTVTAMSFGAEVVARVLGYGELPTRRLRRAVGGGLLVMAVAMPITFRHGLELYAQREAQQITKRVIDPMLQRLAPSTPATPGAGASAVHY